MRIAAIDIGTNSIHMVIASADNANGFEVVDREREVVQIGRGSFAASRLQPDAIRRTVDALQRFVQLARRQQVDRIICTATAAVREAKNGGDFLAAARQAAGLTPRVIPAAEEGRLIYLAVKSALKLDEKPSLIVDIGGGSMQLVVGDREKCLRAVTAPLGVLRLTEKLLESDPPARRELQRLRRVIRKDARKPLEAVLALEPARVYGSSGSIHALAHVAHWSETGQPIELINGHVLSLDSLRRLSRRLQRMTTAEREKLPGIDAKRAEIIVPGAILLAHVLEEAGADGITISDFGVREGLVTDYITAHAQEISTMQQIEDLRMRSVIQCLTRFQSHTGHSRHIAGLVLGLFDAFRADHKLGLEARELLHFAALLHDVGSVIGYDGHAEHSYYIIKHANLRGFTAEELELIANIARYHTKARPRKRDKSFRALSKPQRRMVRWLAAMLRVVEGLDRSHYQLVQGVRVLRRRKRIAILVSARGDAQLEIWAGSGRTGPLARLLDATVTVERDRARQPARRKARPKPRLAGIAAAASSREGAARAQPSPEGTPRAGAKRRVVRLPLRSGSAR